MEIAQPHFQGTVLESTFVPGPLGVIGPENADRVDELARWGQGTTEGLAYSPDGALLAVASPLGVFLYDASTFAQVMFLETPQWVHSVAFSPDATLLAAGQADGTLQF